MIRKYRGDSVEVFEEFLNKIENIENKEQLNSVLLWIHNNYPMLEKRIAWNQPMFTEHGTYIIGFSIAKQHFAVAPEAIAMTHFKEKIEAAGYAQGPNLFKIKWQQPVNFGLIKEIIDYNREDKKDTKTFWR